MCDLFEGQEGLKPELVFALVAATGTDLKKANVCLLRALESQGYQVEEIRLSELISRFALDNDPVAEHEDERIAQAMERGTKIREKLKAGDAVARLGIREIVERRKRPPSSTSGRNNGIAYVIRSLKLPQEVLCLRNLYKDSFHLISLYEPKALRLKRLVKEIESTRRPKLALETINEAEQWAKSAADIISRDEGEKDRTLGQHLQDTFHLADFFASVDGDGNHFSQQIERYVALLFGARFITPTLDEVGSFSAQAAAHRSADLSRQVGAVITATNGNLIAIGYNDVPAAGGGHFVEGRDPASMDHRDYTEERDASAAAKHELLSEVFDSLIAAGWLKDEYAALEAFELTNKALYEETQTAHRHPVLYGTRVTDLLEFGRIVHAEMSALMAAARKGQSVVGATLYCTTFPCHMCARHILAAGISRVVYIEPYPKSQAKKLYRDSIVVDGSDDTDANAVRFEPFVGVAPRQYLRIFEKLERKDKQTGYAILSTHRDDRPRFFADRSVYAKTENDCAASLEPLFRARAEILADQKGPNASVAADPLV